MRTILLFLSILFVGHSTLHAQSVSISSAVPSSITEAPGAVQSFTVMLSSAQTYSVSVDYATSSYYATAGTDFVTTSGTLIFAPGETSKTFDVTILDDFIYEPSDEAYSVIISNALNVNAGVPLSIIYGGVLGWIVDNDPYLSISGPPSITESPNVKQTFTVTLSAPQTYSVSVNYAASSYYATAGTDFVATSGTLIFAPGETSKTFNVTILDDFIYEPNDEPYSVNISNALNVNAGMPSSIVNGGVLGWIVDNDPYLSIASPPSITESPNATQTFTITLSAPQTYTVSVNYSAYSYYATAGTDFVATSGTLIFAPGETSKTFDVTILDDYIYEPNDEAYSVNILNALNVNADMPLSIVNGGVLGWIVDNDPTISLQPAGSVAENTGFQLFTATLSSPQSYPVAVDYMANSHEAILGSDFTFSTCELTLQFEPGETTKVFSVSIIDDLITEPNELYGVNISNARHALLNLPMTISTGGIYATILDNDVIGCTTNILANPVINGTTLYCPGSTVSLTASPVTGASGYLWSGPNNFTASGLTLTIPAAAATHSGVYTVRAFRSGGTICDSSTGAKVNVSVVPCSSTVSLKLYIQGYYVDSGRMSPVLLNHGILANTTISDSIRVELRSAASPYEMVSTADIVLHTNGTALASFPGITGDYYLAIKHKSGLETWSAVPITLGANPAAYDFSNASSKAFGNNMTEVEPGIWAIYSGDINHDENIDLVDGAILEERINLFDACYLPTDLNGDGNSDLLDLPVIESNINNFIYAIHP